MERMMADCRRFESDSNCQLTIIGPEDDVVAAAAQHAAASHGHSVTPELHEQLRSMLEPESAYVPGERTPEPFPA
jgi:plasmid stability protein